METKSKHDVAKLLHALAKEHNYDLEIANLEEIPPPRQWYTLEFTLQQAENFLATDPSDAINQLRKKYPNAQIYDETSTEDGTI